MYHIWNILGVIDDKETGALEEMIVEHVQDNVRKSLVRQYVYMRKLKGLTQADVARKAGISRTNVTRFESGEYNPTIDMLVKIAYAIGVDVFITLKDEGDVEK